MLTNYKYKVKLIRQIKSIILLRVYITYISRAILQLMKSIYVPNMNFIYHKELLLKDEQNVKIVKIGQAIFKINIKESFNLGKETTKVLEKTNLFIRNGDFQKDKWYSIFKKMSQSFCQQIYFQDNKYPSIIKCIEHVTFKYVIYLNIQNNNINSIEGLICLNMSRLKVLYIANNLITNMKALAKLSSCQIRELSLHNNYSQRLDMSRFKSKRKCIDRFYIEKDKQILNADLTSLFMRLEATQLDLVFLNQNKIIKQAKILNMVKQKYSKIDIKYEPVIHMPQHIFQAPNHIPMNSNNILFWQNANLN